MTQLTDCARVEELLSDHAEDALDRDHRAGVEAHLSTCASCRELRAAFDEVRLVLAGFPDATPDASLVDRIVAATRGPRVVAMPPRAVVRPALPAWVQTAAAGFGLIVLGAFLLLLGPEPQSRVASQIVERSAEAGEAVIERKERIVEDVRTIGAALTSAAVGRLERVNDRVEDYRRLLERRRSEPDEDKTRDQVEDLRGADEVAAFRTGDVAGA